jgi:hypothetical protein
MDRAALDQPAACLRQLPDISELLAYEQALTKGSQHHGQSALIGMAARRNK